MVSQRVDARGRATADNLTIQVKMNYSLIPEVIGNYEKRLIPLLFRQGLVEYPRGRLEC